MATNVSREAVDMEKLQAWLSEFGVHNKRLNRLFSSGVLLATILKKLFPRMVELHNYPERNNVRSKLYNWETLNDRVLSKLGLNQPYRVLDKLARSTPGVIEVLLTELMTLTEGDDARPVSPNSNQTKKGKNPLNVFQEEEPIEEKVEPAEVVKKLFEKRSDIKGGEKAASSRSEDANSDAGQSVHSSNVETALKSATDAANNPIPITQGYVHRQPTARQLATHAAFLARAQYSMPRKRIP